jgi:hypothetical protein
LTHNVTVLGDSGINWITQGPSEPAKDLTGPTPKKEAPGVPRRVLGNTDPFLKKFVFLLLQWLEQPAFPMILCTGKKW